MLDKNGIPICPHCGKKMKQVKGLEYIWRCKCTPENVVLMPKEEFVSKRLAKLLNKIRKQRIVDKKDVEEVL